MKTNIGILVPVLLLTLLTGCFQLDMPENEKGGRMADSETEPSEPVTLHVFQFKVEIAEAMNRLAQEYERETGVRVEVETVGGGANYQALLKAKLAAGEEPDIFNNTGFSRLDPYLNRAADLSDSSWVEHVSALARPWAEREGRMYGMPMSLDAFGIIYNKELFAKAGITKQPQTITELKNVMQQLKDAGIQPIVNGFGEWWTLDQLSNIATSLHKDQVGFSEDIMAGKRSFAEDPIYRSWVDLLDLVLTYSNENPLATDYNSQMVMFANGEAAMMAQGNWTQVQLDKLNPNLDIGMLPLPVNDDPTMSGYILVGVPTNWIVNKKGSQPEEAKKFLEWMAESSTGQRYLIEEFKFIPAMDNIKYEPEALGDLAVSIIDYMNRGKIVPWYTAQWPDTYDRRFGALMQEYAGGRIDADTMLRGFDTAIYELTEAERRIKEGS